MVREIMYVIRHGRIRKAWIDPKDIYDKSDVPFVPPDYPTKEMIAEKARREAENAKIREAARLKEQHDDWNESGPVKEVKPEAAKKVEDKPTVAEEPKEKRKYTKRKGGRK